MPKLKVMVLRPTIFEIDALNFEQAKQQIINGLVASKQIKLTDPIEFREIVEVAESQKKKNKKDNTNA